MRFRLLLAVAGAICFACGAIAAVPVSPISERAPAPAQTPQFIDASRSLGEPVDFAASLQLGANYLRRAQADVTEDNAGNGFGDTDPDDGGWDWASVSFTHSDAPSPENLYGVTAQGVLRAYLASHDPSLLTTLTDAANFMVATPAIDSASDLIFLMNLADVDPAPDAYADAAKAKYDAKIAEYVSAADLAAYIRDARYDQGYPNGIIAWDVGAWAVAAQMLDDRYPGQGYDTDADDMAEVVYQDSFMDNPGYFDLVDDQGFDPNYDDPDFWCYNLGITGLIDAFRASGSHADRLPELVSILLAGQHPNGGMDDSYGINPDNEDWQATAYAAMSLAALDQTVHQAAIDRMAYFLAATQDQASGAWVYSNGQHYPEVGGECAAAIALGLPASDVLVDDGFVDQAAVDAYNAAQVPPTHHVLGYDAFATIQGAIDAVAGSTVTVLAGTYVENVHVALDGLVLLGPNAGIAGHGARVEEAVIDGGGLSAAVAIAADDVQLDGFTIKGGAGALNCGIHHAGDKSGTKILNNIVTDNVIGIFPQSDGPVEIKRNLIAANNRPGAAGGAGIYADNSSGLLIEANVIRDHANNNPLICGATAAGAHTDLRVLNNVFDNPYGVYCVGVDGAQFADNQISGTSGLTFGGACADVTVERNTFDQCERGLRVIDYGYGYGLNSGIVAHHNNFLTCTEYFVGVPSGHDGPLDATCNWYGDVAGPAPAKIVGNVVYWPWLDGAHPGGACDEYGPNNVAVAPVDPADCLTPADPCTQLQIVFNRDDTALLRGVSVTFQLTNLRFCDEAAAVQAGTFWDQGVTFGAPLVVDNGGGSYTVDFAFLGNDPCGVAGGGQLFVFDVAAAPGITEVTTGAVAVTAVLVRDCDNAPLPGNPGAAGTVAIDPVAPATVAGLAATQVKTGNDADGTTKIDLAWTAPEGDAAQVEIWRKGFGAYPEYDDAGGDAPTAVDATWTLVATQPAGAPAITDEPPVRDFWYYAAVVIDECGNRSLPSAITGGTLNYHLGDVADPGDPAAIGDNRVFTSDISILGSHYGITLAPGDSWNDLDVGPTTNWGTDGRPLTDNQVQFEDLMVFSMNYDEVAKESLPVLTPAATSAVVAKVNEAVGDAFTVEVAMSGDGRVQGLSVPLTWNAQAVRPVGFAAGDLVAEQGGLGLVLSPQPGVIDAALFGSRDLGICGTGTLATVTFQVIGAGDFEIGLGEVTARDGRNEAVVVGGQLSEPVSVAPARTELYANAPNPFNPSTELSFALARAGAATLRIYTVQGRLVATLVDGELPAGRHAVTWHGRDDAGRLVGSGAYVVRLETADGTQNRRITLMK